MGPTLFEGSIRREVAVVLWEEEASLATHMVVREFEKLGEMKQRLVVVLMRVWCWKKPRHKKNERVVWGNR